MTFNAKVDA